MTFRSTVRDTIDEELRRLHTMQLGRVVQVLSDGTLRVQPLNRLQLSTQDNEERTDYGDPPVLPARPPTTMSCSGGEMRVKVEVGDLVRLDHLMHSIDEHLQKDVSSPVSAGWMARHDLSDCTATPIRVRGSTFAPVGDIDLDCDDLRLGHPADALALVTADFQATLDAWWGSLRELLDDSLTEANGSGGAYVPGTLLAVDSPTLDLTQHVKAS